MVEIREEYTYEEACKELNVSLSTLKRAIAANILTPIKRPKEKIKYLSKIEVEYYKGKPLLSGIRKLEDKEYSFEDEIRASVAKINIGITQETLQALSKSLGTKLAYKFAETITTQFLETIPQALAQVTSNIAQKKMNISSEEIS